MTTSTVSITGDLADALGGDYDARRTKLWVAYNTDTVVTDDQIRLGTANVTIGDDGTFEITNVVASTSLIENLQTSIWFDYARSSDRTRQRKQFGPYDLSAYSDGDGIALRDLETVQALQASAAIDAPAGSVRVFMTDDPDLPDEYPQFGWIVVSPPDTTAPSTPSGLAATPGNTEVDLDWDDATDNVAVTGYRVYRDGVLVGSPSTSDYTDTGLTNGVTYAYTVSAVDGSGNESAQSSSVNGTPAAPVVVIATDNFTGATADDTINGRTTTTGSKTWTKQYGFRAGISSNRLALVAANGSSVVVATIDTGVANHDATITNQTVLGDQAVGATGVVVRFNPANGEYVTVRAYDSTHYLLEWVSASTTSTRTENTLATINVSPAPGDVLRLKAVGTTYTAYINGTQVASVTNAGPNTTSTLAGARGKGSSFSVFLDDFTVSTA